MTAPLLCSQTKSGRDVKFTGAVAAEVLIVFAIFMAATFATNYF